MNINLFNGEIFNFEGTLEILCQSDRITYSKGKTQNYERSP